MYYHLMLIKLLQRPLRNLQALRPFCEAGKKLLYQDIHLDVGALKGEREYSELVNGFAWDSELSQHRK